MSDGWADTPRGSDQHPCAVCKKPTKSHAVCVQEDEHGGFAPASGMDTADAAYPVCHTCYTEYGGDAGAVIDQLNAQLRSTASETLGISPTKFQQTMDAADKSAADAGDTYVGASTVRPFVEYELEPGTVLRINDTEEKMVVVPADEEKLERVAGDVLFPLIEVANEKTSGKGGGLMRSESPRDDRIFYGYADPDGEGVEFVPVTAVEVLGYTDAVNDMNGL